MTRVAENFYEFTVSQKHTILEDNNNE